MHLPGVTRERMSTVPLARYCSAGPPIGAGMENPPLTATFAHGVNGGLLAGRSHTQPGSGQGVSTLTFCVAFRSAFMAAFTPFALSIPTGNAAQTLLSASNRSTDTSTSVCWLNWTVISKQGNVHSATQA